MTVQDILDVAGTADGNTTWGTDMRGAMTTLHTIAVAFGSVFRVIPSNSTTAAAQTELTAAGTSGEMVVFAPGTHSYGALTIPDRVAVVGCGLLTTLNFTGGGTTFLTVGSQASLRHVKLLKDGTLRQAGSVGVDVSNKNNTKLQDLRIEGFATGYKQYDTSNASFYNASRELVLWENTIGFDFGGTQANNNRHYDVRCRPIAGEAGSFGVRVVDARGLLFSGLNVEPGGTNTGNGTGISLDASTRECTFIAPWIENNDTGVTIASGANRNTFIGGTFTGSGTSDWVNSGTATVTINCHTTGTRLHSVA